MQKVPFIDQPCERCGSKKRISRTWKEKIPTFSGETVVEYSQIVCTNSACQSAFDEVLKKESLKRAEIRQQKEENDLKRKKNSLIMAKKTKKLKKNNSRI